MTTAAEQKAAEKAAAEAAAAEEAAQRAAADAADVTLKKGESLDDKIVIRHKDIKLPAVVTRRQFEEVYKDKGFTIDPDTDVDDVDSIVKAYHDAQA